MIAEAIKKGNERYLKNPYWRGVYKGAPDTAKPYYDLIFSRGDWGSNVDECRKEFKPMLEKCYAEMTDDAWDYIISHTQLKQGAWELKRKREEIQQSKHGE